MRTFMIFIWLLLGMQLTGQTVVDIIVNSADHNTLEAAVIAAELADDLSGEGPFTVFAPTDAAFAALPVGTVDALLQDPTGDLANILLYHVLGEQVLSNELANGQRTTLLGENITIANDDMGVFINDALIIVANIPADNGVVHVIDAVLLPPAAPEPTTVVDIIVNSADHNTLEAAVIAAELADDLSGEGPFTVFAPTDAAFAALPAGTLDALLQDPTGDLANILLYHVLGAQVLSTDLTDGQTATTLFGEDITVTINTMGVFINDAQVIVADIPADNGVVHVIDAVLLPPAAPEPTTVVDIIVNSADHNTLEAAVIAAELADDLSGEGPFTVFAPTDAAFAALPAGTLDALLQDPTGDLANILLYHVLGAQVLSTDLTDGQTATTLFGEDITVTINTMGVFINDAQVIVADIPADNGVVHVIDAVLLPPAAPEPTTVVDIIVNSADHNTLEAAVIAAELADDLSGEGPFTVFAPTDAAFAALPAGTVDALLQDPTGDLANILLYHVLGAQVLSTDLTDGQTATTLLGEDITVTINTMGVFINDAQVIVADIPADNGVVHVIDAVLLPPAAPEPTTVVDIIVNSADHNTLEAAVIAAELADDLSGEGPFTVFAPTDAAFAALPAGTVDALLQDPTGDLANILLYHVLGAQVLSTDLTDGQTATTLLGEDITVTINTMGVFINDAQVIVADIPADNGVVHVIDAVLLPPAAPEPTTVVDIIVNSADHNTLEAAVIAAELADDLSGEGPFTVFAPTDAAFAALPAGTLDALLQDPTGDLANILLYHVLGAQVLSTDLTDGQTATTLFGEDITVTINTMGVFINDAQVIVADIPADNGVVHVIDAVLLPPVTTTGTAMVQFIHNAEFETVRVLANGEELVPFFAYKTATPYVELPAGVPLTIALESRFAYNPAPTVTATVEFEAGKTYIVTAQGTFNPDDNIPVDFAIFDKASSTAEDGEVGVQFVHGSYDAPVVDITTNGTILFDDIAYGAYGADFLYFASTDTYILDLTLADDNDAVVESYYLDLSFWKNRTATIFATGSLAAGTFQPWVALSNGGTYPLPVSNNALVQGNNYSISATAVAAPDYNVMPNPARDQFTIQYTTTTENKVVFELFNVNGQQVQTIDLGIQDRGVYSQSIQISTFPTGMYYLRSYLDGQLSVQALMKVD